MAIEIRELLIKVKVEESMNAGREDNDLQLLKHTLMKACKKEIKKQLNKSKER